MVQSTERILTTHVGSLPRPQDVVDLLFAEDRGEPLDAARFEAVVRRAVDEVVRLQGEIGIDAVSDGEMSKISYATYIRHRLTGFEGDSPRPTPQDLEEFPEYRDRLVKAGHSATYKRPVCRGPVRVRDLSGLKRDIANLKAALAAAKIEHGFMNAVSPGTISVFQPNEYYPSHEEYLAALAEAMREEYELIAGSGLTLQLDCPDLAMGRHSRFKSLSDQQFLRYAELQVEALNHALSGVPAERVRLHVCWGNYEGPHHHDVPLEQLLPIVLRVRAQALLFEAANPRHAHEWTVFRDHPIPEDKILVPGVLSTTTNYIEHPLLVAERIERFASLVGRERVIAGTDCGFGTFAGFGPVEPDIAYLKLASMVEGARIASERLWKR